MSAYNATFSVSASQHLSSGFGVQALMSICRSKTCKSVRVLPWSWENACKSVLALRKESLSWAGVVHGSKRSQLLHLNRKMCLKPGRGSHVPGDFLLSFESWTLPGKTYQVFPSIYLSNHPSVQIRTLLLICLIILHWLINWFTHSHKPTRTEVKSK